MATTILVGTVTYQPISFNAISNFEYELPDPLDPSSKPPASTPATR